MAQKPFTSVDGFAAGEGATETTVILANGDVTTNNITVSNRANLGAVGNVIITGGTTGQYLKTDGSGNLSWDTVSTGGGAGGSNTQIQYNDNGNFAGNSTFTFDSATGVVAVPNIAVSGNILPAANASYSLGNSTNRFSNLYVTGASGISLGSATLTANSTAVIVTNPQGAKFVIGGSTDTSTSLLSNGNSNITIAANSSIGMTANGVSNVFLVTKDGVSVTGNAGFTGDITALGNITAIKDLSASNVTTNGNLAVTGDISAANLNISGSFEASGNLSGININTSGELNVTGNGNIQTNLYVGGNAVVSSVLTVGNPITPTAQIFPNGYAFLTKLDVNNGNISGNNLSITSNISVGGTATIGTLSVSSVNSLGNITASNISASGNLTSLNANLGNLVKANFFQGDGYLLTNLTIAAGSAITNGNSNVSVAPNANVTFSVNGTDNVITVTSDSMLLDGNMSMSGNATAGNLTLTGGNGGYLFTHHIKNGNSIIDVDSADYIGFSVGANTNVVLITPTGVAFDGTTSISGTANITGNLEVTDTANIDALNANSANVDGNIVALNANLGNLVEANFFAGDGYLLTNLTIAAGSQIINGNSNVSVAPNANVTITANGQSNVVTVTGSNVILTVPIVGPTANVTTVNANAINSNYLSVQNSVDVNADISANGTISANNLSITAGGGHYGSGSFDGNVSVGNHLFVTGYSNLGQLNVSSVTVHNSLNANDTVSANFISASYDITASRNANISGNLKVIGTANLSSASITGNVTAGNIDAGNTLTANYLVGDGYLISNLTVPAGTYLINGTSNLYVDGSGNVRTSVAGSANVFVVSSTGANVSGTISASGNANVGNLGTSGLISATGNVTAGNLATGGSISVTGNANVGGYISAAGNLTTLNANLGNLAKANFFQGDGYLLTNLTIPAGTAITNGSSNVLVTHDSNVNITVNGTPNVVQVTEANMIVNGDIVTTGIVQAASFANGSSNIAITNNGPVDISINGTDGVLGITGTGIYSNVKLYATQGLSVSGNANLANLGVSGFITTPGNISAANATISNDLTVAGQSNLASLRTTGAITAIGNVIAGNITTAGLANVQTLYVGSGGANINGYTKVSGNLDITGNVNVTGNVNYSNVTELVVGDPLIYMGANNTGDLFDLGIVASYNNGTYYHTGLARNHNTGFWTFFDDVVAEPTTVIDWANAVYPTVKGGNFVATGNVSASGNVTASYFLGNIIGNISGNIAAGSNTQVLYSDNGNIAGNTGFTFNKTTGAFAVPGNITGANLIGIYANGNSNISIPAANGNILITATGNANIASFSGIGFSVGLGSLTRAANVNSNSPLYVVGNISSDAPPITIQNRFATGYSSMDIVSSSNIFMGAVGAANPSATSVPALANLTYLYGASGARGVGIFASNGNITMSAAGNANIFTVTGTGTNVSGTLNSTGNLTAANANLGNLVTANYGIIGGAITGQTYQLVVKSNGVNGVFALQSNVGGYAEASFFNASNTQAGGVGYAGSSATYYPDQVYVWSSNGIAFGGNGYSATGGTKNMYISNTGIVTVPTGVVSSSTSTGAFVVTGGVGVSGNIYIGGLVSVTGNGTFGNVTATTFTGALSGAATTAGTVTTAAQPNITSVGTLTSLSVSGNANIGNIGTAGLITVTGNGTFGNISTAGLATITGNVTAGNIITAGTANAAILTVSGNANIGNIGTAGLITATGNLNAGNIITAGIVSATGNGTFGNISTAGIITATGTVTAGNLTTGGNLTVSGKTNLGAVGNITITGGTSGYVLSTDGAGNLSWAASGGGGGSANIAIYDEGTLLTSAVGSMNFVGTGVTATAVGSAVTVTVTGGNPTAITLDTFSGNGVQTAFTLSTTPTSANYTSVNIDGVDQLKTAYTVVGSTLTFSGPPSNGSSIEVTTISATSSAQPSFTTRNYSGNGVQTTYTVSSGVTDTGVLVTLNGLLQTPTTDYTVSGSSLTFTTAPASGQAIQIRELGTVVASTLSAAGSNTQIQFNDANAIGGNANLTFNKTTSTLSTGNISASGTVTAGSGVLYPLTSGTAQASTSGTAIDFTGIPSWVKRITVMLNGVSTTGISIMQLQVGAGSITTTGYVSTAGYFNGGATPQSTTLTTGFGQSSGSGAADIRYGTFVLTNMGSNTWIYTGQFSTSVYLTYGSGGITLGSTLDRVRLTMVNGTDTFDSGSVNILYE